MNPLNAAANAASWRADWAWSLPLIVLTVVIHVFGLGFLHERVVRAVGRIVDRRDFTLLFGAVMGIAVLLLTVLHRSREWFGRQHIGCSARSPMPDRRYSFRLAR